MFKDKLKEVRVRSSKTQEFMAEKVEVTSTTYAQWERGNTEPKSSQIEKICITLEITPNELFDETLVEVSESEQLVKNLKKMESLDEYEKQCLNQIIDAVLIKNQIEKAQSM